jgi:integrator complex subunit 11
MLHGGLSMEVFKKWAPYENNLVIMPGIPEVYLLY